MISEKPPQDTVAFTLFVDSQAIDNQGSVEMLIILDILSNLSQVDEYLQQKTSRQVQTWITHLPWIKKATILKKIKSFGIENIDVSIEIMKAMNFLEARRTGNNDEFRITIQGVKRRAAYNRDQESLMKILVNMLRANLPNLTEGISEDELYEEFFKACTKLVAQDIFELIQYPFIFMNIRQDSWIFSPKKSSKIQMHCDELAKSWKINSPSEYVDRFFLMCELYVLYAVASFENTVRNYLQALKSATLYLDTNVLVSLVIEEDRWHPITMAFLRQVKYINKNIKKNLIRLCISDMTLRELDYLINHTQNSLSSLSYARNVEEAKHSYDSIARDNSIVLEFFKKRQYPNLRALQEEIGRRLKEVVEEHKINVEKIDSKLDPGTAGNEVIRVCSLFRTHRDTENIRHKVYLLRLAESKTLYSGQAWIWSYNREQIRIEKMMFDQNHTRYSIYGRYIRGILDPLTGSGIKLLQKDFSEYFLASALYHRDLAKLKSEAMRLRDEVIQPRTKRTGLSSDEQVRLILALHMEAQAEQATKQVEQIDETLAAIRDIMSDGEVLPSEI